MDEKKAVPLHRERLNLPDHEDQQKLREQKKKQLKDDMRATFNTPAGRRVLRYLMNLGGYKRGKIGGNAQMGMDVLQGTLYNTAREQLVLELIEFVPDSVLKDCEFGVFEDLL